MKRSAVGSIRFAISTLAALLVLETSALAGPPLICHAIDIGQARSLPWSGNAWNLSGNTNYDLRNLVTDTLAILDSNAPVLVRMETLRRATLYARGDPQVAKQLLLRLYTSANNAETAGRPDASASFDVGYLIECYRQWLGSSPAAGLDGYAWVKKAIKLRGTDAEMEFAAALITLDGPQRDRQEHLQRAMAGAKGDPLLARNLGSRFNGETMADMLGKFTTAKN